MTEPLRMALNHFYAWVYSSLAKDLDPFQRVRVELVSAYIGVKLSTIASAPKISLHIFEFVSWSAKNPFEASD